MCGKKLSINLRDVLEDVFDIPVVLFDSGEERPLPCVIVGFEGEDISFAGGAGHYTVHGFVQLAFQGYEDKDNSLVDAAFEALMVALNDSDTLAALNAPATGIDTRTAQSTGIHKLSIRSVKTEEDGHSNITHVSFDAFCIAKNLTHWTL